MIRKAKMADIPSMVVLSEQKRRQYQSYQPVFWRKAQNAEQAQKAFFEGLLPDKNIIALVYDDSQIRGFVIARVHNAPPVYDPGGLTCTVDDFCVAQPEDWFTVGEALLNEVALQAKEKGSAQVVVVCGHLDIAKREMLAPKGFDIASEWFVKSI